jgi:D-alanyl-D-alanine carboxypeptidase
MQATLCALSLLVLAQAPTEPSTLETKLQAKLDEFRERAHFPGATFGLATRAGVRIALATGVSDRDANTPMRANDRMLAGSVGKTFFAALALRLVADGKLALDEHVEKYLGSREWFARLPNAHDITVRQLMNHTSGLVRYELDERFLADLSAAPDKAWKPEEELAYLFDTQPPFAAGKGWDYSDTNYIVLGLVIESLIGEPAYAAIRERYLEPLELRDTLPSTSREIPGLVQGYAGAGNPFGGKDAMLEAGRFAINPQFEWAGGGFASTSADLARWALALWGGDVIDAKLMDDVLAGVDAPMLGAGAKYGLCVILRDTPLGPSQGHAGYFPGYVSEMRYYPERGFAVAMQVNSSARGALSQPLGAMLQELARIAAAP